MLMRLQIHCDPELDKAVTKVEWMNISHLKTDQETYANQFNLVIVQ